MKSNLNNIAIDLTPILPGGENGGAKIFVLELINQLALLAPKTSFILLTQQASHAELAALDTHNIKRVQVLGNQELRLVTNKIRKYVVRLFYIFPHRIQTRLNRLISAIDSRIKNVGHSSLLHNLKVDLLFCPFTAPTYSEAGIPTVLTIYDLQYKTYPEFFSPLDVAHRDRVFLEACKRGTMLSAISNYSREKAIDYGKLDPKKIRTIYLRMAKRMSNASDSVLRRFGLAPGKYFIFPANFWRHKNHEILLTAFGIACKQGLASDIKLICTGASDARSIFLSNAVKAMNLEERIIFPGFVSTEELSALLSNSLGMIFPSLYEGFGLPVMEAMAAGVPVACSNLTSLPEIAGNAAILFDPRVPSQIAQAMIELEGSEHLRSSLIKLGQNRASLFSDSKKMAKEYWSLFNDAVNNYEGQNQLTGVYADGWATKLLTLELFASSISVLKLELDAPEWLPQESVAVQFIESGKPLGEPEKLERGKTLIISKDINKNSRLCQFRIEPSFIPVKNNMGEDARELTVLVKGCSLVENESSNEVILFPEEHFS